MRVPPEEAYAVAADLHNLPAWWIEHLSADVETPAARLRDAVYAVRYRLPGGLVIGAVCTVVAARSGRSLTYMWEGGGMRLAVGQSFDAVPDGTRMHLIADLHVGRLLSPVSPLVIRLMRRRLAEEVPRALDTLVELVSARAALGGRRERRSAGRAISATGDLDGDDRGEDDDVEG